MRVFLITLFLLPTLCFAQNIVGKYSVSEAVSSNSGTIIFFKNGTFSEERYLHLGTTFGMGKYTIKKDRLYLAYLTVANQDTSAYELITEPNNSTIANVKLNVFDNGSSVLQAMVYTRDKSGNPLSGSFTDKNGNLNLLIFSNDSIAKLSIDVMGYYRADIPIALLVNRNSELTVRLKPAEKNYIPPKKVSYKLLKSKTGYLSLIDKTGRTVKLIKL